MAGQHAAAIDAADEAASLFDQKANESSAARARALRRAIEGTAAT